MKPLDLGTHICHLYRKEDDLRDVTLPFIRDGLRHGDSCLYVAGGMAADDWNRELVAQGIDVPGARGTGALAALLSDTWRDLCQQGSVALAREVLALVDLHLGKFDAVRIAGDFAWATAPAVSADALCHWEATANVVFEGLPARVICQYDIDRYEPAYIHAALRTHPIVLYNGRRVRSPYYDAPAILEREPTLNESCNDREAVAGMLSVLA